MREPRYVEPKNHPGIRLDMSYGQCACFMCRDKKVTNKERDLIFKILAQDILRKSMVEASVWLDDWTTRHGTTASVTLKAYIDRAHRVEVSR